MGDAARWKDATPEALAAPRPPPSSRRLYQSRLPSQVRRFAPRPRAYPLRASKITTRAHTCIRWKRTSDFFSSSSFSCLPDQIIRMNPSLRALHNFSVARKPPSSHSSMMTCAYHFAAARRAMQEEANNGYKGEEWGKNH